MPERQPRAPRTVETDEEQGERALDPRAVNAFDFLTNQVDYSGMTYREKMASDENLDGMRTVERRRGHSKSQNTLYLSELLVGSKYSDNVFFDELIQQISSLPAEMKPDEIVIGGLYLGDFGGRDKNSKWMLKPGLRTLEDQFGAGREVLDQLKELGMPVVYTRSDNDTKIIEEMTYEGFRQLEKLGKQHTQENKDDDDVIRQWSTREKFKANPNWPEYYRFTKYVAFPYCMRTGHMLRTAAEISRDTDGEYDEPEREILFDAYKRVANGSRLQAKHLKVLDKDALKDNHGLTIVGDFEHDINTRGQEYTDLVRHKFHTTNGVLANYFKKPAQIRGVLASEGDDPYDNVIITGQQEAAGVFRPDNKAIHSIGGLQNPRKALQEDGDILTSSANTVARQIFGRGRFHEPSATAIERTNDGIQRITLFNKGLMEVSESIPDRTMVELQCDWQAGNLAARPDYQLKQLDMINRSLGRGVVYLGLGGDFYEGRNYFDFNRESGRTGLGAMDQQVDFVTLMVEESLDQLTPAQMRNLFVKETIGNHEWNSGTMKVNGYSFADPLRDVYRSAFRAKGFSLQESRERVQFQDTLITKRGEPVKTYSTTFRIGEMGFELRHFFGAGKGTGGQPPAFSGHNQSVGLGDTREDIHVGLFGHYHHPNYMLGGNKLYLGAGSLNGMTGFEYERNLRSANAIVRLYVGGGLPPQIEVLGEEYLAKYKIPDGPFSDKELRERHGFKNDSDANPIFSPYIEGPKTALQRMAKKLGHQAAYSTYRTGSLGNPNS
ncbi:MAG: hypothetical protein ABIP74_01650 [Candidatus Saccharimonas sp.]